jgi:hypothetical protein
LFYTPVTKDLTKAWERLGDLLHVMKAFKSSSDSWWAKQRAWLLQVEQQLELANRGRLLGPPLVNVKTGAISSTVLDEGEFARTRHEMGAVGPNIIVRVSYHDSLPDTEQTF